MMETTSEELLIERNPYAGVYWYSWPSPRFAVYRNDDQSPFRLIGIYETLEEAVAARRAEIQAKRFAPKYETSERNLQQYETRTHPQVLTQAASL